MDKGEKYSFIIEFDSLDRWEGLQVVELEQGSDK